MIRLVLFDIDGTLIRTGGAGVKAFARVFETEFGVRDGFERLKFAGRTDVSLIREFFGFHNIPLTPETLRRFTDNYAFWLDHILSQSEAAVCPGVMDFICELRRLPNPPCLGLLTGNFRLGAEIKLRHLDLWTEFEIGAFADDHEERDRIAAIAFERGRQFLGNGLAGGEVLVIGDTPFDIRCGRAIGSKVLAVATGGAKLDDLRAHRPDWAVKNLTGIRATEICL